MLNSAYILQKLISIPLILLALTGHELAHGWVSYKLGDPTPKRDGRLTLNPLAHLDPIGALLLLIAGFGWAKPVMINPQYYKNPKAGTALVSAAGPAANLVMAFLITALYAVFAKVCIALDWYNETAIEWAKTVTQLFASYNLSLMLFNLIPIPPLDGSKIVGAFLPNRIYYKVMEYERYYSVALIILIFVLMRLGVFERFISGGMSLIFSAMVNLLM